MDSFGNEIRLGYLSAKCLSADCLSAKLVRQIGLPKSMFTYHIVEQFHFGFILFL